jgi:hypothetical protein
VDLVFQPTPRQVQPRKLPRADSQVMDFQADNFPQVPVVAVVLEKPVAPMVRA